GTLQNRRLNAVSVFFASIPRPYPGGAPSVVTGYFYCGDDFCELDAALYNRFKAERARYLILVQRASDDNIPVLDPDRFAALPPLQAVRKIIAAGRKLRKRIDSEPLGLVLCELQSMKKSTAN
ncbi:MAG: hypothetical protein J5858_16090, partial [Lentisphaeria bacterium]|nr:hypothetical protein [Lentisphaeria bacterium]